MNELPVESIASFAQFMRQLRQARAWSQKDLAESLGLSQRSLSYYEQGQGWPRQDTVFETLADLSGMPIESIKKIVAEERQAASRTKERAKKPAWHVDVSQVFPIRRSKAVTLTVVTDPSFFDSGIFAWIFDRQPFRTLGIDAKVLAEDWVDVPQKIADHRHGFAIGFYNRNVVFQTDSVHENLGQDIKFWADLCIYLGYALMVRGEHGPEGALTSQKAVADYINTLRREHGDVLDVVSIGSDTQWMMDNTVVRRAMGARGKDEKVINPLPHQGVESSLMSFLDDRHGVMYVGGLPQRMRARDQKCTEVISFQNEPTLFSVNSLICTKQTYDERADLLNAATALWFETIRRIKRSPDMRHHLCTEIPAWAEQRGWATNSLTGELYRRFFSGFEAEDLNAIAENWPQRMKDDFIGYELFPDTHKELVDHLSHLILNALAVGAERAQDLPEYIDLIRDMLAVDKSSG